MATPAAGTVLRLDHASRRQATRFSHDFNADARARIAADLGIIGIAQLRIAGRLTPVASDDWQLEARVHGRATQECVVSFAPVDTAIDEDILRQYLADLPPPPPGESESPAEDVEEAPAMLDLTEITREVVALALPPWPRSPDVEVDEWQSLPPGATPIEARRPFAALAALRGKLPKDED